MQIVECFLPSHYLCITAGPTPPEGTQDGLLLNRYLIWYKFIPYPSQGVPFYRDLGKGSGFKPGRGSLMQEFRSSLDGSLSQEVCQDLKSHPRSNSFFLFLFFPEITQSSPLFLTIGHGNTEIFYSYSLNQISQIT